MKERLEKERLEKIGIMFIELIGEIINYTSTSTSDVSKIKATELPPQQYDFWSEYSNRDYLTTNEIMDIFGVTNRTVYNWIMRGNLKKVSDDGKKIKVCKASVIDYHQMKKGKVIR